ncbi:MAG: vacuolar transporter [Gammaproteobacteria bacterium]|nr:vacuolar transporter [Gammaproteobacteria bacterium]|tara:strand:- start:118670 stop:119548 length:879 start_codon:yes stop_codon:yes gene_type:complete
MKGIPNTDSQNGVSPLAGFSGISLSELDSKAELLERMDQKYIVNKAVLYQALAHWMPHFAILDINNKRTFRYNNCYFDDAEFSCYKQHQQGKRTRFKVRTRKYMDSASCFVEMKLKGSRNRTLKRRLPYSLTAFDNLDESSKNFIKQSYYEVYAQHLDLELQPSIQVSFNRTTLAGIKAHERITVDSHIQFSSAGEVFQVDPDLVIIETKSLSRNGLAEKILRRLHQHPVPACSKYCIGMAVLGKVKTYNRFLRAMRKLRLIPAQKQQQKRFGLNKNSLAQNKYATEQSHVA